MTSYCWEQKKSRASEDSAILGLMPEQVKISCTDPRKAREEGRLAMKSKVGAGSGLELCWRCPWHRRAVSSWAFGNVLSAIGWSPA